MMTTMQPRPHELGRAGEITAGESHSRAEHGSFPPFPMRAANARDFFTRRDLSD